MKCGRCGKKIKMGDGVITTWFREDSTYIISQICVECTDEFISFMKGGKLCQCAKSADSQ